MNLTKAQITKLFKDNAENVVIIANLSNSAKFNLGLSSRYPKGTILTFDADSVVVMHQFVNKDNVAIGTPTLCLKSDDTYISVNSLSRKGYSTESPNEGQFPTVKINDGVENVLFNEIKEGEKSIFTLKNSLKLTSRGSDTFNYADFKEGAVSVTDGKINTVAQSATRWTIEAI
jgi:hypothetical protein